MVRAYELAVKDTPPADVLLGPVCSNSKLFKQNFVGLTEDECYHDQPNWHPYRKHGDFGGHFIWYD